MALARKGLRPDRPDPRTGTDPAVVQGLRNEVLRARGGRLQPMDGVQRTRDNRFALWLPPHHMLQLRVRERLKARSAASCPTSPRSALQTYNIDSIRPDGLTGTLCGVPSLMGC